MKHPFSLTSVLFVLIPTFTWAYSPSSDEVNQVQSNVNNMDQKMDDLMKRFSNLELKMKRMVTSPSEASNLGSKLTSKDRSVSDVPDIDIPELTPEAKLEQVEETLSPLEPESESQKPHKPYSIRLYYSATAPLATDFLNYQVEYEWGHQAELRFARHWSKFFLAGSIGAKAYRTDTFIMPYSTGHLILPAKGMNYSTFGFLSFGFEHYFSERSFMTSSLGFGAGWAWDKIQLDSTTLWEKDDPFLYGMFRLGLGYRLFDSFSALMYYQLDGQGERNHYETQLSNQVGVSLGVHF